MKRNALFGLAGLLLVGAGWQAAPAIENMIEANSAAADPKPAPAIPLAPRPTPPSSKATPMAERVAVIGLLNKRNGIAQELTLKPGQAVRVGDVVVRLRACETTAPWEDEPYTGAFVQLIVHDSDEKWRQYFSGWLYKESPSLNVVEHPVYDVWPKSCKMRHIETGPDTLVVRSDSSSKASSAPKSDTPPADAASASPSNAM